MENRDDRVEPVINSQNDYTPQKSSASNARALIPIAVVSAVVCFIIMFQPFIALPMVSRSDFETNIKSVMDEVRKTQASATDALNKANTASQDVKSVKEGANNYATQASVAALQSSVNEVKASVSGVSSSAGQINTLSSKVDTLTKQLADKDTTITSLQTQIANLQTQVNKLNTTQTNGGGTLPTTGTVSASIVTNSNILTSFTIQNVTNTQTFSIPFKVKITNGLNKEITDLQLYTQVLGYATSGLFPTGTATLTSSSGGTWSIYASSGSTWYFSNTNTMGWTGSGLVVPANSTKTITLIFNYTVAANQNPSTIQFSTDIAPVSQGDYNVP